MLIRQKIQEIIKKAILEAQKQKLLPEFEIPEVQVFHPEQEEFGDYSTNIAMRLAKSFKKPSEKIAQAIVNRILSFSEMKNMLSRIEIKKPGFINITLERKYLLQELAKILKEKENYGNLKAPRRNKILVEFISANPTGKLHVGHGRGAFWGDVLVNLLKKAGYKVTREYYINDSKQSKQIKALGELIHKKTGFYQTEFVKQLISQLKKEKKDLDKLSSSEAGYLLAQKIQLYNRQFIEQKLKIHFDVWFSEEDFYRLGKIQETLAWLETMGLVYKKEGALWFKTKLYGDEKDRVLIRKNGQATYFMSDIVYHRDKFERGFDKLINIWGADHHGYVDRMQAAVKAMGREGDLDILIAQMVRLVKNGKEFKLSKRKGIIVDLEWLIDEVGLDVSRFFFLMKSLDTHMDFNLDLAKEQSEKNPVFYVQYAHTRIASILRKAKDQKIGYKKSDLNFNLLKHPAELSLIRELIKFPELIDEISKNYRCHYLTSYAISLADKFHNFYEKCRVLDEKNKELSQTRLALILATKIVLKNTLDILGVKAPERM